ncbi:molecular chaperone [Anaerocolumna jejuensis]|uniref:molecular chaperone n=1 Tax=Anaerocolumna jejuensis TaxID=259063 RepID=UPI003F7B4CB9
MNMADRKEIPGQQMNYYRREELELMTTYQLREICWKERIVNGIQAPLDKDELILQIMRFRGRKDNLFIQRRDEESIERLEKLLQTATIQSLPHSMKGCAKIITYQGIEVGYFDRFTIGYRPEIADTNALLVSGNKICAIFQVRQFKQDKERLYLTKSAEMPCEESAVRSYQLYCMERAQSDWLYHLYETNYETLPAHLRFYMVPVLDFRERDLLEANMPLVIDFGTSNTTAGTYLDSTYIEKLDGDPVREVLKENDVNYVTYLKGDEDETESPVLPSVVGVTKIDGDKVEYVFGYQADRLFHMSYIDEGFCVFYDLKRWISDADKMEELVDRNGHRCFVKRKDIIKEYLEYVISCATGRFKCRFKRLHISAPVKQKKLFTHLFKEILADYQLEEEDMLDEGVAVLYNSISDLIERKSYRNDEELKALIIDCGGGTTDLSSCRFSINNQRVSYKIEVATSYENGDTDFGGNNLTFRILELLKIALARQIEEEEGDMPEAIVEKLGTDIFRRVDQEGIREVYRLLDEEYEKAEKTIPTRFKEYEHKSNNEYFAVKNNFYYLFGMAEQIKKIFYGKTDILRVAVSSTEIRENAVKCILAERFKLSVREAAGEHLKILKDIPTVYISINELNQLLKADIYGIIKRFIEASYENGELQEYSIMRLTGQSCKIDLFREALKEFIPGKVIASSKKNNSQAEDYELKLMCLDGAIKYIKDKRFGYADVRITNEPPAFPYIVTAITHTKEEKILIQSLDRRNIRGYISRNMADLTLQLYLKDTNGNLLYKYNCSFYQADFETAEAEEIVEKYHNEILQDDVDSIVDRELRCFVLADEERWGFAVVPVLRNEEQLMLGPDQFYLFEIESWLMNFFDGTK